MNATKLNAIIEALAREGQTWNPADLELTGEEAAWLLAHIDEIREWARNEARIRELREELRKSLPPQRRRRKIIPIRRAAGFTIVEMVCVLVILAVCAAIVAPSLVNFTRHQRICSESYQAVSALRLARERAVAHDANYMVDFEPMKNRYVLATIDHFAGVQDTTVVHVYKIDRRIHLQTPDFHGRHAVVFYPDGSASATGQVMFSDGREKCVLSTLQCTGRVALRFE